MTKTILRKANTSTATPVKTKCVACTKLFAYTVDRATLRGVRIMCDKCVLQLNRMFKEPKELPHTWAE